LPVPYDTSLPLAGGLVINTARLVGPTEDTDQHDDEARERGDRDLDRAKEEGLGRIDDHAKVQHEEAERGDEWPERRVRQLDAGALILGALVLDALRFLVGVIATLELTNLDASDGHVDVGGVITMVARNAILLGPER